MRRRPLLVAAVVAIGLGSLAVARTRDEPPTRADLCRRPDRVEATPPLRDDPRVVTPTYEHVATVALALAVADVPDGRVLVATKDGHVWQVPAGGGGPVEVLDLSAEVAGGTEQGLLGIAVAPAGDLVYLSATFADGTARLVEMRLTEAGLDLTTRRDVLAVEDPHPSHNGGKLAFDRSGMLIVALGDGGNGDRTGAAQDLTSLFGKLLRIDPRPVGAAAYSVPADNPFVGQDGVRPEIWSYGFRNPWGWSIDSATDDLWVGDVGHLCFEEISLAPDAGAGGNFGWPHLEGAHEFVGPALGVDGEPLDAPIADVGVLPEARVAPLVEYGHGDGRCSVIGGVVYRGAAVPALQGVYLWADLCERAVFTLREVDGRWLAGRLGGVVPTGVVAFAQRGDGEVYLLSLDDGLHRLAAPAP